MNSESVIDQNQVVISIKGQTPGLTADSNIEKKQMYSYNVD